MMRKRILRTPAALAAGIIALLCASILGYGAVYSAGILVLELGTALLFAVYLFSPAFHKRTSSVFDGEPKPKTSSAFLLLTGLVIALQLLTHRTAYFYATYQEALLWTSYLLLYFLAGSIFRHERCAAVAVRIFAVFGPALALFALIQHAVPNGKIYWLHLPGQGADYIFGPYVNRNHYAGIIELLAPFSAVLALESRLTAARRGSHIAGTGLMYASVLISGSRAGILCCIAQLIAFAVITRSHERAVTRVRALLAISLLIAVGFTLWPNPAQVVSRFSPLQLSDEFTTGRVAMFRDALGMTAVHVWLGFGLHTFADVYPAFRSFPTNLFVNELHNDVLQLFVELGLIGGAAFCCFLLFTFRAALQLLPQHARVHIRLLRTASFLGVAGLTLHSFFDFHLHIPANAACFFVLAACATVQKSPYQSG
jgi:O-antigen ligase